MDSKACLQLGEAMAKGLTEGVKNTNEALINFARAYAKSIMRPLNKAKHYHLYSKRARIRKKYAKMYEFAKRHLYFKGSGTE